MTIDWFGAALIFSWLAIATLFVLAICAAARKQISK